MSIRGQRVLGCFRLENFDGFGTFFSFGDFYFRLGHPILKSGLHISDCSSCNRHHIRSRNRCWLLQRRIRPSTWSQRVLPSLHSACFYKLCLKVNILLILCLLINLNLILWIKEIKKKMNNISKAKMLKWIQPELQ